MLRLMPKLKTKGEIRVISRLFLLMVLAVAACSPPAEKDRFPTTPPGITAIISQQSQDFDWEVTDITNDIITTATYWNRERVIHRKLYRGLYPIYGMEFGKSFEVDFDYKILDELFPLKVGNEVTFEGTMNLLEDNYQAQTIVNMKVASTGIKQIGAATYPVYRIDITAQFSSGSVSDINYNTIYYSADLGLILKSVTKGSGAKSYWNIRSIDVPKDSKPKKRRRRPSGTVLI